MGYGIAWFADEALTMPLPLDTELADGATYYAANTNGDCKLISFAAAITIYDNLIPPTVHTPVEFCTLAGNLTLADLWVNGQNLTWYPDQYEGYPLPLTTPLVDGMTYWVSQSAGICESERSYIQVNIDPYMNIPAPEITTPQYFCAGGTFTLEDIVVAPYLNVVWYDAEGNVLPLTEELAADAIYYATLMAGECEGAAMTAVQVFFRSYVQGPAIGPFYFCADATIGDIVISEKVLWYDVEIGGTPLQGTHRLETTTYYAQYLLDGDCYSLRTPVEVVIDPIDNEFTEDAQGFCMGATLTDIVVTGYGVTWYAEADMINELPLDTELVDGATYYAANTSGDCQIKSLAVTVSVYNHLQPPAVNNPVALCSTGGVLTLADLWAQGEDVKWYADEFGGYPLPMTTPLVDGTIYWAAQGTGDCESDRSYVLVNINNFMTIPAPVISSPQEFCAGNAFTLADISLPQGMSVVWYNAAGDPLDITTPLVSNTTYYAALLVGECEGTSLTAVQVLFSSVVSGPVIGGPFYFCEEATIGDIVVPTGIVWYDAPNGGAPLANGHQLETGTYYAAYEQVGTCAYMRTPVEVEINPATTVPAVEAQSFCAGATLANIVVTGYGVTWFEEPAMINELPLDTELADGVTYYGANTNGDCKLLTLEVTITLFGNLLPPTVQNPVTFCTINGNLTLADITVTGQNITWYADQFGGYPLPVTTPLVDGGIYWVSQSANICESERSYVQVIFNPYMNIPAPDITGLQYFCENGTYTLADITVAPFLNIVWYDAAENVLPITTPLVDGETYYAALLVGECQGTDKTPVTVEFTPTVPAPDAMGPFYFCGNATIGDIVAPATIVWYDAASGGAPLANDYRLTTGTYYAAYLLGGDCESDDRTQVEIVVDPTDLQFTEDAQGFCLGATLADISVVGYGISWFEDEDMTLPLSLDTELVDGVTYYAANISGDCMLPNVAVTVSVFDNLLAPIVSTPVVFCSEGGVLTLANITVVGQNIKWYADQFGGYPLPLTTPVVDGGIYWVSQGLGACESARSYVQVQMNNHLYIPAPDIAGTQYFCDNGAYTLADITVAPFLNIVWYDAAGTVLPLTTPLVDGATYYATTLAGECESTEQTAVTVEFTTTVPAPVIEGTFYFCADATIADIVVPATVVWYDVAFGGTPLAGTTKLVDGATYWAAYLLGGDCGSERTPVTVAIEPADYEYDTYTQNFCTGATLADITVTGYAITWFAEEALLTELPLNTPLVDGATYYAANTNGDCKLIACAVTVGISTHLIPPTMTGPAIFCDLTGLMLVDLMASNYVQGTNIKWYASQYGNDPLSIYTLLADGVTFWASQSSTTTGGACESERSYIQVIEDPNMMVPAPELNNPYYVCNGGLYHLSDIVANNGEHLVWYNALTGGTLLDPVTTLLINGNTYYAAQLIGNCESTERTPVQVIFTNQGVPGPVFDDPFYFCSDATISDIPAPANVIWYANAVGGAPLSSMHQLATGTYYAAYSIGNSCISDRTPVVVVINPTNKDYDYATQGFCDYATLADITITGYGIAWFADEDMTIPLPMTTELVDGATYYAANTNGNCLIKNLAVTVSTSANLLPPTVINPVAFCAVAGTLTLADIPVMGQNTIVWYADEFGGYPLPSTTILVDGGIYWASQNAGSCESARTYVKVTIDEHLYIPAPVINSPQFCCIGGTFTLADMTVDPSLNIVWYDIDGNVLPLTTTLVDGETYYAASVVGDCASAERTPVTVEFTTSVPAPTMPAVLYFCENATIADIIAPSTIVWYDVAMGGTPLPSNYVLTTGIYYAAYLLGLDCESERIPVQIEINPTTTEPQATDQYFCFGAIVADIEIIGYGIKWYADAALTIPANLTDLLVDGVTYYAVCTSGDCSILTSVVTAHIYDNVQPPVLEDNAVLAVCDGDEITTAFLLGLIQPVAGVEYRIFEDAGCFIPFVDPITTDYAVATSHTFYVMAFAEGSNCTHDYEDALVMTIVVNPIPEAPTVIEDVEPFICSGNEINVAFLNSWLVYNSDEVIIEYYMDEDCLIPFTPITTDYNTATSHTFYAIARSIATGCATYPEDALEITILVDEIPAVVVPNNFYYCNGEEVATYEFTGTDNTTFEWTVILDEGVGLTVNSGTDSIPHFTATNIGFLPIKAILSVTPYSVHGCEGETELFMIIVNPKPVTEPVEDMVYCHGVQAPAYCFTSDIPDAHFAWEFVSGTNVFTVTEGSDCLPTFFTNNTGNAPIVGTYRVQASYTNGGLTCEGAWETFDIVVLPYLPAPTVNPETQDICSGDAFADIIFSSNVTNATYTWQWASGDNFLPELELTGTGNVLGRILYNNTSASKTANYNVVTSFTYGNYSCASTQHATFSITVNPVPAIDPVEDMVYCHNVQAPAYCFTSSIPGIHFTWEFVSGTNVFSVTTGSDCLPTFLTNNTGNGPIIGTYKVRADFTGTTCGDAEWEYFDIVVLPYLPAPTVSEPTQTLCSDDEMLPILFSSNIVGATYKWQWISGQNFLPELELTGEGDIAGRILYNTDVLSKTANYQVITSFTYGDDNYECVSTPQHATFSITVKPKPTVSHIEDQPYCNNALTNPIQFSGNNALATYHYEFGGGEVLNNAPTSGTGIFPSFLTNNTEDHTQVAIYRVWAEYDGCKSEEETFTIIVFPTISITDISPKAQTICSGDMNEPIEFRANVENVIFKWSLKTGYPFFGPEGEGNIPAQELTNNGTTLLEAMYEVTAIVNGAPHCMSNPAAQFRIAVKPVPFVTSKLEHTLDCTGLFDYTIETSVPEAQIRWDRLPHPAINDGSGNTGAGAYIHEILNNSSAVMVTVTYAITLQTEGCREYIYEMKVHVLPNNNVWTVSNEVATCANESVVYIEYGDIYVEGAEYKLEFKQGGIDAGFRSVYTYTTLPTPNIPVEIPQGVAYGNYMADLYLKHGDCPEKSYPIVIMVRTVPTVVNKAETEITLCENEEFTLFVEVAGGNLQYQWYLDGVEITGATEASYTGICTQAGTYMLEISNECGSIEIYFNVRLNPLMIEMKWDDVLFIDNTGDIYVRYQWYQDGQPISKLGSSQYYTVPGGFPYMAEYNVRAYKADGSYDEACPIIPNKDKPELQASFIVYPSPSVPGEMVTFFLTLPEGEEYDADAVVFDVRGRLIGNYHLVQSKTEVNLYVAHGTYTVRVNLKSGREFVTKFVVQK
jgi:glutathione S-transferase